MAVKIIHRIGVVDTPDRRDALSSLGIKFETPGQPFVRVLCFDIDESNDAWDRLLDVLPSWNSEDGCSPSRVGIVHTEFSRAELADASFHKIDAWLHGYPQPEYDFGYREATFHLSDYCRACGIGRRQKAPFRLKGEPKWGRRQIFTLNWVPSEYFVRPDVWESIFRPMGVACSVVLDHRTGNPLNDVVQLNIKDVAESPLDIGDNVSEVCKICHRKKYLPICRGYFPAFSAAPTSEMFRTREYFGSGAVAWNATVVSSRVFRVLQDHKVVGVVFTPLATKLARDE